MFTRHFLFSTLAVVACAVPASATISYYTDPNAFNTATTGTTSDSVSFDSFTVGEFFNNSTPAIDGVTFTGAQPVNFSGFANPNGSLVVAGTPAGWPSGNVLERTPLGSPFQSDFGGSITIDLPSAATAFSFLTSFASGNFGGTNPITVTVNLVGGGSLSTTVVVNTVGAPSYLGAVTDTGTISSVILSAPDLAGQMELGQFLFDTPTTSGGGPGDGGDPGSAPEPATFFLIGTGLIAVPLLRRRLTRA